MREGPAEVAKPAVTPPKTCASILPPRVAVGEGGWHPLQGGL